MAEILAIPRLYDAVVARFVTDGTVAENFFGWREPPRQNRSADGARIVWVPGDDRSGDLGKLGPARYPGETTSGPRSLATLGELVTVYISARDAATPELERAQYIATRLLYDAWFRAVYKAGFGTVAVVSSGWVATGPERRHGGSIRVVLAVDAKVPDEAHQAVSSDTSIVADVTHVEDLTETVSVTSTAPEE